MGANGEQLRQTPKPSERAGIKPINEQLYSTLKNIVERRGGEFLRGGEEVERHLDAQQAAASQVGGAIMFHDPPNTSEALEEVFHFQQDQRGDYSDLLPDEMVLRREIAAQNYLLSVTKRYSIPDSEVELTKKNLAMYEGMLADLLRRKGEGS